jgi:hypothetical protein
MCLYGGFFIICFYKGVVPNETKKQINNKKIICVNLQLKNKKNVIVSRPVGAMTILQRFSRALRCCFLR